MRTSGGSIAAARGNHPRVARDITDAWVHLCQGNTQLGHGDIMSLVSA
jgi:hypothetical protein